MQEWIDCFIGQRRVAICIPVPGAGHSIELFWYGMLASLGIFLGAWLAAQYVKQNDEEPNLIWDSLLWILVPGLIGARLWYVAQEVVAPPPRGEIYIQNPLEIINFRGGGMNIFGGIVIGLIAVIIYTRVAKKDGWLLADAALLGALIGQAIGRIGNWVNEELYGPPTDLPWGIRIPAERRIAPWTDTSIFPVDTTRFHPTFFYEAIWLVLSFVLLVLAWRRWKSRLVRGAITAGYMLLAGVGRFWIEWFRPDQPRVPLSPPYDNLSFGRLFAIMYVFLGVILLLDRYNYIRIPFIKRPVPLMAKAKGPQTRSAKAKQDRDRKRSARHSGT